MKPAILAALLILSTPASAYRSPWHWDLHRQERHAIVWARHCRVMYGARHYQVYGCR